MTWTDPGAFPVAPGVTRIPLPLPNDGLRAVNVYVLETPEGLVLVDGGWAIASAREVLVSGLAELGAGVGDISRFLVTHVHRDHYTMAVALRRETGARVALGRGEKPTLDLLQHGDRKALSAQVPELRRMGAIALADGIEKAVGGTVIDPSDWESPDEWLTEEPLPLPGGRVLETVPTPGHTAGHVVFHDLDAGLLFAGDHVLPTITPSIGFEPVLQDLPLAAFLRSLALVRSRPDARLLPAHGMVTDSVHARVDQLVTHHENRLQEVLGAGDGSPYDVAQVLRWTRHGRTLDELDGFNQMLAVFETAAHLDLLVAQDRLVRDDDAGLTRYRT